MNSTLSLPRRVSVYYLLFCTASIAWLTVGAVVVSQATLQARNEGACLTRLGKAAASVGIDYVRHGERNLQRLVERFALEGSLAYCAVVSPDGRALAHSQPGLVGRPMRLPAGERIQWGEVSGVRFLDDRGSAVREYRAPLAAGGHTIGSLCMAVSDTDWRSTVAATASYAPWAVLAPLVFVGLGALFLSRMVSPLAEVELQLRRAALVGSLEEVELQPVRVRGGAAWGWNRLVQYCQEKGRSSDLEERLRVACAAQNQSHTEQIVQSLSDGVAATDAEGRVSFANHAFAALLGSEEINKWVGKPIAAVLGLADDGDEPHPLTDASLLHRTVTAEIPRVNALGERVLRVSRRPLYGDKTGGGQGFVWSLRDVTQQKLADRMRDQFLDSATHELRTPLTNIRAYAETLALNEVADVEQQKEFCNIINSEAIRLARFVDELLCISSLEAGSLVIDKQKVELDRLLSEAAANVRPLMDQKDLEFQVTLPPKLPEVKLDKDKFSAALVNLLGNAAKYTPPGGRVGLKVRQDEWMLSLDVEDTGVGISEEELPKVFDKFFRSEDRRVRQQTGTGLGLSFANEIIRLHGGAITVKSEFNKGSTFTISVPLA